MDCAPPRLACQAARTNDGEGRTLLAPTSGWFEVRRLGARRSRSRSGSCRCDAHREDAATPGHPKTAINRPPGHVALTEDGVRPLLSFELKQREVVLSLRSRSSGTVCASRGSRARRLRSSLGFPANRRPRQPRSLRRRQLPRVGWDTSRMVRKRAIGPLTSRSTPARRRDQVVSLAIAAALPVLQRDDDRGTFASVKRQAGLKRVR